MINEYSKLITFHPDYSPVRHKRKIPFSPNIEVSETFARRMHRIRELDQELGRFILKESDYLNLIVDAYSSNIHWSTKIEGNPLPEDEVRRISRVTFSGGRIESPGGPAQEIINHLSFWVFSQFDDDIWNSDIVCNLHNYLLKDTGNETVLGKYREKDCNVKENGVEVFVACPHQNIKEEMDSLLTWVRTKAPAYEPVVAATIFFHEFESIHPFEDGNGRTGRTLFHLYLMKHGLPNSHLCKMDYEILNQNNLYYELLAYTDEKEKYGPLVDMFSIAVLKSYEKTREQLSKKDLLSSDLDEISRRLIIRARKRGDWFSLTEATSWVNGVGNQTIRNRLNDLVIFGVLQKRGQTRSCAYRFMTPFSDKKPDSESFRAVMDPESIKRIEWKQEDHQR